MAKRREIPEPLISWSHMHEKAMKLSDEAKGLYLEAAGAEMAAYALVDFDKVATKIITATSAVQLLIKAGKPGQALEFAEAVMRDFPDETRELNSIVAGLR